MSDPADLTTLLSRLAATGVELILVGGLAAVAQGAPIATFDADIVHRRTEANVDRLMAFLLDIGAHHRGRPPPPLPPDRQALLGAGHSLLATRLGQLDVLGAIEQAKGYEELLPDAVTIGMGAHTLQVLSLEAIVRLKRTSTHPKDKLRLPILEAVLRRR
jgi:hypothetical protein